MPPQKTQPGKGHSIIVAGASAGGVEALRTLTAGLPEDFRSSVFIVLHVGSRKSLLPDILARATSLPVAHAEDGMKIEAGHVYVAPPDLHLSLERGRMRVQPGPRENGHRPSVDVLFRSAAEAYGPRVVGIVLTGGLDDGSAGLQEIKRRGGIAIVQDPQEAPTSDMPLHALHATNVDYCVRLGEMPDLLVNLARRRARQAVSGNPGNSSSRSGKGRGDRTSTDKRQKGHESPYTCPECKGTLYIARDGDVTRFRCRVGHAYTLATADAAKADEVEAALWTAVRVLEESASLSRRLAGTNRQHRRNELAERFEERAAVKENDAKVLLKVLEGLTSIG